MDSTVTKTPYLSPGITLGLGTERPNGRNSFIVGGEVSVLSLHDHETCSAGSAVNALDWMPDERWLGVYLDGVYYTRSGNARFTLGPEVGWNLLGLDGGVVLEDDHGKLSPGFAVRGLLTFGYVQLYLRGEAPGAAEAGLLLKWPFELRHDDDP